MQTASDVSAILARAAQSADASFRSKFLDLPRYIADWAGPLDGRRILDFGCGRGPTVCAIALTHPSATVWGVDVNQEYRECLGIVRTEAGLEHLPPNLFFETIAPGQPVSQGDFDLIYSWSTFEHIDQNLFDTVVAQVRAALAPRGRLYVQISPLYFSPEGSHLFEIGYRRWDHLQRQLSHIHAELYAKLPKPRANALWSMFSTLNQITAPQLIERVCKGGFKILREYRTATSLIPPRDLLAIYQREVLTTEQVVVMFGKA